ncbi:hypothetical protein EQG49_13275 [Periweissella cryptocerci]|uniref:Uncharacterized protein n=1 Tax=Periweissella cryptocerci TaxID=2506420 RepID=A0A4P6YWY9_9LACO|nr:hypothetical protein [Periweissella cryptocerci]QBO37368.1 hypothetical protein EQG49_13275 [Periweissella cryptocerci]
MRGIGESYPAYFFRWWKPRKILHRFVWVGAVFLTMIALFVSARFDASPISEKPTPLNMYQGFVNSNDSIALVSKKYSETKNVLVAQFAISNSNDGVTVPFNKLAFQVQVKNLRAAKDAKVEIIPTTESHFVLLIRGLKDNYKALTFSVANINDVDDLGADDSDLATDVDLVNEYSSSSSSQQNTPDILNFYVLPTKKMVDNKMTIDSKIGYAVSGVNTQISVLKAQIKKGTDRIELHNKEIQQNQQKIKTLQDKMKYDVQSEIDNDNNTIQGYQSDIGSIQNQIDSINANNKNFEEKIALLEKQKSDIKAGVVKLGGKVVVQQMK